MTGSVAFLSAAGRVRAICSPLELAVEHDAWTGTAWRVRGRTFAHVLEIRDGRPAAYSRVFRTDGPAVVVTFQCFLDERAALEHAGPPFFLPRWRPGIVGVAVNPSTDWEQLGELLVDSHATCLPHRAGGRRPGPRAVRPHAARR